MRNKPLNKRSLYEQVADRLREEIASLPVGERLESEPQLMQRFEVSSITIRGALRILHSEGLLDRQQGRGTFVAQRAKSQGGRIALLIDQDISSPQTSRIYLSIAHHLQPLLRQRGLGSMLYIGGNLPGVPKDSLNCPEFIEDLQAGRISGVAAILALRQPAWLDMVKEQNLPMVTFGGGSPHSVTFDTQYFIDHAIETLVKKGRRNIGLIGWQGFRLNNTRMPSLFEAACRRAGVQTRPEWIVSGMHPSLVGAGWEAFREIWISQKQRPDGVIVTDDLLFSGASMAIKELKIKVPEEMDLVTWANLESGIIHTLPVIQFEADPKRAAEEMDRLLWDKMQNPGLEPRQVVVPVEQNEHEEFVPASGNAFAYNHPLFA